MAEKKHFLRSQDLSASEVETLFWLARQLKRDRAEGRRRHELSGRHIALYLEKPSVRTRISFTVGVRELGGDVVELVGGQTKLGAGGEHPFDFAAVVSRYCHAIVARVYSDEALAQMAQGATVPVINALSDGDHPCQALADFFTLRERFNNLKGLKLAYVGDGKNNVARSLIDMGKLLGVEVRIAAPEGYQPDPAVAAGITVTTDPKQAVEGVHAIYTDTWVSMGTESEADARRQAFAGYKVDEALLAGALPEAVVMHCLPAVRDEEIEASLIHGPRSVILDQAENRLHTQKALLLLLVENRNEQRSRHDRHDHRDHGRGDREHGRGDREHGRGDREHGRDRDRRQGGQGQGQGGQGQGGQGQGSQGAERQGGQGAERQGGQGGQGGGQGGQRPPRQGRPERGERGDRQRQGEPRPQGEARPQGEGQAPAEGQTEGVAPGEGQEHKPGEQGQGEGHRRRRRGRGRGRGERSENKPGEGGAAGGAAGGDGSSGGAAGGESSGGGSSGGESSGGERASGGESSGGRPSGGEGSSGGGSGEAPAAAPRPAGEGGGESS